RFPTDADGQSAAGVPPGGVYGYANAIGLAQVGDAIYMASQQGSSQGVYQIDADGANRHFLVGVSGATGIVANPNNGHLFVSSNSGNQIRDVDPIAGTSTVFFQDAPGAAFDGLTISADGSILYAARTSSAQIVGINTTTHQVVFTSGAISGGP